MYDLEGAGRILAAATLRADPNAASDAWANAIGEVIAALRKVAASEGLEVQGTTEMPIFRLRDRRALVSYDEPQSQPQFVIARYPKDEPTPPVTVKVKMDWANRKLQAVTEHDRDLLVVLAEKLSGLLAPLR